MESTEPLVSVAVEIATRAHAHQLDKADKPYIAHPLRVMGRFERPQERMVAVLHDVVEDTQVTLADLRAAGMPESVVRAVDALTRRTDESAADYYERVKADPLALRVKLADMLDNLDIFRFASDRLDQKNVALAKKYCSVFPKLVEALVATGHPAP
jgi:(p)ppGpp synthase/HD superfamily hydrolase